MQSDRRSSLADRIRSSLDVPAAQPPIAGDLPELRSLASVPAAVLVAITDRSEPGVILTVRREHLRTHAGQISFPGGRADPGEDPIDAALREAHEELGLAPDLVETVARLDDYRTVTGYVITPVVGIVAPDLPLEPHEHEVADWFEAPLHHLLDPRHQRLETAVFAGRERRYWQIEWNGHRIWGATAAMLVNLSRRLQWS
jgi:8-oxo-dGTP pyrophosphatase MutT (NUDIX family)